MKRSPEERFASFVGEADENGCMVWLGCRSSRDGEGWFTVGRERRLPAHRFAYELAHGPIPAGQHVHHVCENRACVNPDHLVAMSRGDHVRLHQPWRNPKGQGRRAKATRVV